VISLNSFNFFKLMSMFYLSTVKCRDNSGVKTCKLLNKQLTTVRGSSLLLYFGLIKKVLPHKKVKRGEIFRCVVVQSRYYSKRLSGYAKASSNVVVLLKPGELVPLATRIHCRLFLQMRYLGFLRVLLISRGLL